MNITVPYFLGITNMGVTYSDLCTGVSTHILTRWIISLKNFFLFILGTGSYLPLNVFGMVFSYKYKVILSNLPIVTKNNS